MEREKQGEERGPTEISVKLKLKKIQKSATRPLGPTLAVGFPGLKGLVRFTEAHCTHCVVTGN